VLLLGQADSVETVRALVATYLTGETVEKALAATRAFWESTLCALQVRTPLASTDFLLNRWLLYQTMSCRFWARTAFFQSSGAFGFRDQLQDSMAFLFAAPELTRAHILTAASRQFLEGDVQHWWHAETGMGVRTRCSDDLVWLPFVVARYVDATGDTGILDEAIPFLDGPRLGGCEQEHMFVPTVSTQMAPLWDHCRRALEHALRLGPHGLPLFGNGDWNDGMNRVGIEGRGETVWLAWFLAVTLESFARLVETRESGGALAANWRKQAAELLGAVEQSAWDGEWYLRGFFDNGAPLGSRANAEARIDSLPQSWAVISGAGHPARARQAMDSADRLLVDEHNHLVRLFTPPFDHSEPNPGYIMGYPPGIRENGGQYTHGSLWLALARARMGEGAAAVRLLKLMNPVELSRHPEDVARYRGEPYVASADVYDAPGHVGRSGWTWYTGSAGWMYRTWIEEVLGFQLHGRAFSLKPAIPDDWPGFGITYRYRSATYKIEVVRQTTSAAQELEADGKLITDGAVPLMDDGAVHPVKLRLARLPGPAPDPRAAAPAVKTPASGVTNGVSVSKSTSEKVPLPNRGQ
jgi:cyclic beta-1,2-glucan synthetase